LGVEDQASRPRSAQIDVPALIKPERSAGWREAVAAEVTVRPTPVADARRLVFTAGLVLSCA